jgi:hypothetical protein
MLGAKFEPYQHANHWNQGNDLTDAPKTEEKASQHLVSLVFLGLIFVW